MKPADLSSVKFGTSGVRGLVADLTDKVCYIFTRAFIESLASDAETVVIGHDLRPSSPAITSACIAAIEDSVCRVIYAGALPTPAIACYAIDNQRPAVVVTGSHIPYDRNGIKFYRPDGEITKADEDAITSADVTVPEAIDINPLPAIEQNVHDAYIRRYVEFFGAGSLSGMRVAVYQHSSVARDIIKIVLESLGADVIPLGRTDLFVPVDTEAVREEDVLQAEQWAREYTFDALVTTDGDADRPMIADENGQWLRGDIVGILTAMYACVGVVVTPVSSNTALEKSGFFDTTVRTRIGSPYVIDGMQQADQHKTVVGFEANGGFLLGSDLLRDGRKLSALPTRDALLPILALLSMARERKCRVSELPSLLPQRYTASDRIKDFPVEKSRSVIAALTESRQAAGRLLAPDCGAIVDVDTTDGFRATFESGDIVHLRPSGNAPELRCYTESDSPGRARRLCEECLLRVMGIG
ncbi:MAG: phosphomannomutase [Chlorobium sp.]|nr:MAG: phosphomannomutase [Chlorobium sp.]